MAHTSRTCMERSLRNQTDMKETKSIVMRTIILKNTQQVVDSNSHSLIIRFVFRKPDYKFFFNHKTQTRPAQKVHQLDVSH